MQRSLFRKFTVFCWHKNCRGHGCCPQAILVSCCRLCYVGCFDYHAAGFEKLFSFVPSGFWVELNSHGRCKHCRSQVFRVISRCLVCLPKRVMLRKVAVLVFTRRYSHTYGRRDQPVLLASCVSG